jgi:hypothetical protein
MKTGTMEMQLAPDQLLERVVVVEPISNEPNESWERYGDELASIFGFRPGADPDPSEWFPPDELDRFGPYFEAVRRARRAALLAEEALGRRRVMARDVVGRDRANREHARASRERDAASAQQRRLDRIGLGEIRLRAADRLEIRRQGVELPADLRFR